MLFAFGWLAVLFALVGLALIACRANLRTEEALAVVLAGFLFCSLSPLDISFIVRPGSPKALPISHGKARKGLQYRALTTGCQSHC